MGHLGEFEQLILYAILQLEDGAYGVSIRETIEDRTGRTVSVGAIYTVLGRLEDRGLVASRVEPPQGRPGRPRKFYTLRRDGANALLDSWETIHSMAGGVIDALQDLAEGRT